MTVETIERTDVIDAPEAELEREFSVHAVDIGETLLAGPMSLPMKRPWPMLCEFPDMGLYGRFVSTEPPEVSDDEPLIAMERDMLKAHRNHLILAFYLDAANTAGQDPNPYEEFYERIADERDEAIDRIMATPARSIEGVSVRVRLLRLIVDNYGTQAGHDGLQAMNEDFLRDVVADYVRLVMEPNHQQRVAE